MLQVHDSGARWRTMLEHSYANDISALGDVWPDLKRLEIKFDVIEAWDPEFAEALLEHPRPVLDNGSRALQAMCKEAGYDIDPVLRVTKLPPDSKRNLRDLGSKDVENLITSDVIITKVSELKPRIYSASFSCNTCGHCQTIEQPNELELIEPLECAEEDGGCGRSAGRQTRLELVIENSTLINNQWLEIQELPENTKSGAQPSRMTVLAERELTGKLQPGMRVKINGIPFIRSQKKGRGKTPMFDVYISLHSCEQENLPLEEVRINEEEIEAIIELSERDDLKELLTRSIAPHILMVDGLELVKRSLVLQLFGGVARKYHDGTRSRGDIHILIMGDPGIAKSQLLSFMGKISPRGKFTTGGGTTSAGLTAAVVRDAFSDGRFSLEAGALVLADMGLCAVDEFDKMSTEDQGAMHEAMEQQLININKAGISSSMPTRCAVLAAANPKRGRFHLKRDNETYNDQIDLSPALISRFDIIWLLTDDAQKRRDSRIGRYILSAKEKGIPEHQIESGLALDPVELLQEKVFTTDAEGVEILSASFFRKYVAYSKLNIHPSANEKAKNAIVNYYAEKRGEIREGDDRVPLTARSIEGILRLAEANSRMHLREEVTIEDAEYAIALDRFWRYQLMGDSYDEGTLLTGQSTRKRSADRVVSGIVRNLCREKGDCSTIDVYNQANDAGFDEDTVDRVLRALQQRGTLYSPTPDTWRLA